MAEQSADLGLTVAPDALMTSLSGGEAARVGLLALLLSRFDVLLLDEPTNDLDLDGLDRLERFVADLRVGAVVVSHDREFLRRCVTTVVELDLAQQRVEVFGGGYEAYLAEREVRRRHAREAYDEYAETKADLTTRMRSQRAWAVQGVTKEKKNPKDGDKAQRDFRINRTEKQASKVRATERLIERLDEVEEPRKEWQLQMEIAAAPRSGSVVSTANRAVVRRGDFTLGPVDLSLAYGDRVAVVGPNGAGKTTLIGAAARPDRAGRGVRLARRVGPGRRDRPGPRPRRRARPARPTSWNARCPTGRRPTSGPCWPSSACGPTTWAGPRSRSRPANAPAPRSPCCRPAAPTCSSSTSRPTTSTCRRSSSSRARWPRTPGTLVLVSHDRRLLEAVHVTRRLHVDHGRVEERPV